MMPLPSLRAFVKAIKPSTLDMRYLGEVGGCCCVKGHLHRAGIRPREAMPWLTDAQAASLFAYCGRPYRNPTGSAAKREFLRRLARIEKEKAAQ